MGRRLLTVASVLSLLMGVATVVLWVRSYWFDDRLFWDTYAWDCESGGATLGISHGYLGKRSPTDGVSLYVRPHEFSSDGVSFGIDVNRHSPSLFWVRSHFIFPVLLFALLPSAYILLRHRRKRMGVCAKCSYNLTGNTSGVCPECGTAVAGKAEGVA